jgi:hypothetical protein
MREAFERAAYRAGQHAARAGVPFIENPFASGIFRGLAALWGQGWSAIVAAATDGQVECEASL